MHEDGGCLEARTRCGANRRFEKTESDICVGPKKQAPGTCRSTESLTSASPLAPAVTHGPLRGLEAAWPAKRAQGRAAEGKKGFTESRRGQCNGPESEIIEKTALTIREPVSHNHLRALVLSTPTLFRNSSAKRGPWRTMVAAFPRHGTPISARRASNIVRLPPSTGVPEKCGARHRILTGQKARNNRHTFDSLALSRKRAEGIRLGTKLHLWHLHKATSIGSEGDEQMIHREPALTDTAQS